MYQRLNIKPEFKNWTFTLLLQKLIYLKMTLLGPPLKINIFQ